MKKILSSYIDYSLLKPYATERDIHRLCKKAKRFKFATVCVYPVWVRLCKRLLRSSGVRVGAVVGFPLGGSLPQLKAYEAALAVRDGASEIDMVINIGALKSGDYKLVEEEIKEVLKRVGRRATLKVIIETCYLKTAEKITAAKLVKRAGAHFIKTSTGFGSAGAKLKDVRLFKRLLGKDVKIKAAGGIRTEEEALEFINAGADRIGTSSYPFLSRRKSTPAAESDKTALKENA
jgi:deoxyribose-phosphate aldolase